MWWERAWMKQRKSYLLALGAVAVHAVLYRLVAGLADGAAGHLHSQAGLRAPLDGSLQPSALRVYCRETHTSAPQTLRRAARRCVQMWTVHIWNPPASVWLSSVVWPAVTSEEGRWR